MRIKISERGDFIFGADGNRLTRLVGIIHPGLDNCAGIRVCFTTNSGYIKISYEFNPIEVPQHCGASMVNGLSYIIFDKNTKAVLKKEICVHKNRGEISEIYNSKAQKDIIVQLFLPSFNKIEEIYTEIEDNAFINSTENNYLSERPIVFTGGSLTLGAGATFPNAMFSNIVARNCVCDFHNLALDTGLFLNIQLAEAVFKFNPRLIISEICCKEMSLAYLSDKLYSYLETLYAGNEKINCRSIVFSQPYMGYKEKDYALKREFILNVIKELNRKYNTKIMYLDGEALFAGYDKDKISFSINFLNDYGNFVLGNALSDLARSVSYGE